MNEMWPSADCIEQVKKRFYSKYRATTIMSLANDEFHPILARSARIGVIATALGYTCLDQVWLGWGVKYRFSCANGHVVHRQAKDFLRSRLTRCRQCFEEDQWKRLQNTAEKAQVMCLEAAWLGSHFKYHFKCSANHFWKRSGHEASKSAKCPICLRKINAQSRKLADGLGRLQKIASAHGGKCLSKSYEGVLAHYSFRCAMGHVWVTAGRQVIRGRWCRLCAAERSQKNLRLDDGMTRLHAIALQHDGACLDTVYLGQAHHYRFRCRVGHVWMAKGQGVLNGAWCKACAIDDMRLGIDQARQVAAARGGRCLSSTYATVNLKMAWQCHKGHVWFAIFRSIRSGHWCPECARLARITNPNSKARRPPPGSI